MNENIAQERKPGPVTEEGKARARLNALKDGKYSKLLSQLKCDICKRKEVCPYFSPGQACSLRGEISKTIMVENLDIYQEAKQLYELAMTRAIESVLFGKKDADEKIEKAGKMLDRLREMLPEMKSEERIQALQSYFKKKEIVKDEILPAV